MAQVARLCAERLPAAKKPSHSLSLVWYIKSTAPNLTVVPTQRGESMLQQLWDSFVLLIPVFFLLTLIFGAGFYIGRVSKRE